MTHHSVVARAQQELSLAIAEEEGMRYVKHLAQSEQLAYSEERVNEIASGCAQWLAAAFMLPRGGELLMFTGQVEGFLRLVILDTDFFKYLYRKYADTTVRYKPVAIGWEDIGEAMRESIGWTIEYLRGAFGDKLDPELVKWEHAHGHELLIPAGIGSR